MNANRANVLFYRLAMRQGFTILEGMSAHPMPIA